MNQTDCQEGPPGNAILEYITMAGVFLTFIVNIFQVYSQKNHKLQCRQTGCCAFDMIVSDSE